MLAVMDFSGKDLLLADAGVAVAYLLTVAAIAVGLLPMTPLRVKVAKGCLWGACVIFALLAVTWGAMTDIAFLYRATVVGLLCAIAGVAGVETSRVLIHANNAKIPPVVTRPHHNNADPEANSKHPPARDTDERGLSAIGGNADLDNVLIVGFNIAVVADGAKFKAKNSVFARNIADLPSAVKIAEQQVRNRDGSYTATIHLRFALPSPNTWRVFGDNDVTSLKIEPAGVAKMIDGKKGSEVSRPSGDYWLTYTSRKKTSRITSEIGSFPP